MISETSMYPANIHDQTALKALIKKYAKHTPRYTSYPTAVEFHAGVTNNSLRETLQSHFSESDITPVSLYVHIPFCHSLCYFCACNKIIPKNREGVRRYLDTLCKEISHYAHAISSQCAVKQLHWGGGTPHFLTSDESVELFSCIQSHFPKFDADADISIEIDPRTLSVSQLEKYTQLGFNRISLGVQDFDPVVQKAIHRVQSVEQTKNIIDAARTMGISSINVDLIYGLPEQTEKSFVHTIQKVLELRPERIALYGYAHVTWKQKVQKTFNKFNLPSAEERITLFLHALELLTNAGYLHIGMDHFSLPEDSLAIAKSEETLRRNFMGYTTHKDLALIGFGASSISHYKTCICMNETSVPRYEEKIHTDTFAISKGVTCSRDDILVADVIESLLCHGKIDIQSIEKQHTISFYDYFSYCQEALSEFESDSLIEMTARYIIVSELGRLFLRNIASCFDQYIPDHQTSTQQRFSQSI